MPESSSRRSSAPREREHLEGTVERVTFFAEDTGFAVLKVDVPGRREPVTVVGKAATVTAGETVAAEGHWVSDRTHGRQFRADGGIRTRTPASVEGIARYLGSGLIDGVGPVSARRIVDRFGADTLEVIDTASRRLEEVEGIGPKRRREIKASWERQKAVRRIMLFLHEHGIPTARAVRIYRHYGDEALDVVRDNPYQLAEDIHGIGFKSADQVAGALGIRGDDPRRLRAGLLHVLEGAAAEGHAAAPRDGLTRAAAELLAAEPEPVAEALGALLAEERLVLESVEGSDLVYLPRLHRAEQTVARRLAELTGPVEDTDDDPDAAIDTVERTTGRALAASQRAAVRAALRNRLLVITGGPGVGKTTIVDTVLRIVRPRGIRPVLAAPTGRAARRLSESADLEARTLHRLLEYQPSRGFGRNRKRPLDAGDLYVLDEASMIDTPLMAAFLAAVPDTARLLLVGDVDQLPSVGPGAVLQDIIASGAVPVVRLTEVFRQAAESRIVRAAHDVDAGRVPEASTARDGDFFFIERDSNDATLETVLHLVAERIPAGFHLDPLHDIQVLTPMNRGPLGTLALNAALQSRLNPPNEFRPEIERFGTTFRTGDRVIQTRNNYDLDVTNGDIGTIVEITAEPAVVHVRFPDGRIVLYAAAELDELDPAFAITVHKSQGSEFPAVVVPVTTSHFVMLQRNLLYTAITRGKRLVVLVGSRRALEIAVHTADATRRTTGLRARLAHPDDACPS